MKKIQFFFVCNIWFRLFFSSSDMSFVVRWSDKWFSCSFSLCRCAMCHLDSWAEIHDDAHSLTTGMNFFYENSWKYEDFLF